MKEEIIYSIRKGEIESALELGEQFLNTIKDHYFLWLNLQSKYNEIKGNYVSGLVSQSEYNISLNKINAEILEVVIKIDREIKTIEGKKYQEPTLKNKLQNTLVDSYEILEVLSEGTSTVTYKARELLEGDIVAIRALKTESLFKESQAFEEVSRIKKVNHRNIISILGKSPMNVVPKHVILEYIDGRDLYSIVDEYGQRPISEIQNILLKISHALYYLHKRKIFNADLRASKILIDKEGEPMISPFIVFRTKDENNYRQIISNLKYMSYQRLNSKDYKHFDPRSNQFSLGVIAYLMIVGIPLFEEESLVDLIESRTKFEKDNKYRTEKLAKLEGPEDMVVLVRKLLSKERGNRYANMREVILALQNMDDNSNEYYRTAQESYSRACSFNSNLTFDLLKTVFEQEPVEFQNTHIESLSMKLHNVISLLIETNSNKSYLMKVLHSQELSVIFTQFHPLFIEQLFKLLKESDYLWSEKVYEAWKITLDESLKGFKTQYLDNAERG